MSDDVARFRATYDDDFVVEHPHGDYVRYTAYTALAARLCAAEAENARLRGVLETISAETSSLRIHSMARTALDLRVADDDTEATNGGA